MIDKDVCDEGFIWNPSNCDYECYKSCDFSEYLDYKNCECKKRLVNKLVEHSSAEEYIENTSWNKFNRVQLCWKQMQTQFLHAVHCFVFNNFYS